jgi:TM2 domain-containing membrane protein YozV
MTYDPTGAGAPDEPGAAPEPSAEDATVVADDATVVASSGPEADTTDTGATDTGATDTGAADAGRGPSTESAASTTEPGGPPPFDEAPTPTGHDSAGPTDAEVPPSRGAQAQQPAEPGWWQASDGWWYPPEAQPGYQSQAAYQSPSAGYATAAPGTYPAPAGYATATPYGAQPKSRLAAGLLGIFLGGFGVHRFYLGYTNIGIIQILVTVFTCGLGSIWGLVEGIMILARSQQFLTDADGVPLTD